MVDGQQLVQPVALEEEVLEEAPLKMALQEQLIQAEVEEALEMVLLLVVMEALA